MIYEQPRGFWTLKKFAALITIVVIVIASSAILLNMAKTVPAGYKGVLLNWGEATGVRNEGFNWVAPIGQDIALVNIQIQKATATESAASSDLQEVTTTVAVNYQIDSTKVLNLYKTLRNDYESRVITPNIQEALKSVTARYVADQLITNREDVKDSFLQSMIAKLQPYGIQVLSVSVTDFQFSPSFTDAIEKKVTAEQDALAAKNKLEQITYEAQQQVIQAQAAANATVTTANAQAQKTVIEANATASAIDLINQQIATSPQYLEYLKITNWDGQLPTYWGGDGNLPFVYIPTNSTLP
jgi:regulator of protease activity HflC (stomatin/prohibitin superfamily)